MGHITGPDPRDQEQNMFSLAWPWPRQHLMEKGQEFGLVEECVGGAMSVAVRGGGPRGG